MSGLKWVTISRVLGQVLTWVNTFIVIRLISPTDFGLSALAGLFANFLLLLSELGFSVALVQRQTRDEESLRNVFGALLAIGTGFSLALVLAAPIIGTFFKEPRLVPLIRLVSVQFLAISFGVIPQARLSMDLRFKELAIIGTIASLISAATTLIIALNGGGAWSLIIGIVVLSVSRTILLNLYCPSLRAPQLQLSKIRHLAGFSGLVLLERTLWYWYMQIDSFVVGRSLGAAQLGIYAVGRQLTNIPLERAMEIINSIALPAFSLVKHDLDQVRRGYLKVLRLGAGYAFPVFWGLALVSEPLVRLVLGVRWVSSALVIQVLCISMPLRMLNSFTSSAVTALARQDVNIKSLVLAMVLIPCCVIGGSHWGVVGVAAGWAVGFPIVYLFNASLVRHALEISIAQMLLAVWPSVAASAVMCTVTGLLNVLILNTVPPAVHVAIAVPFGALVYVGTLWIVSRRSVREMLEFAKGFVTQGQGA